MKRAIPRYTFYKNKYGSELLVDVVDLKSIKKYLEKTPVHTLTYYDITFITEGTGSFSIDNQVYKACPGDVIFSKPGEIRTWDKDGITNGYALILKKNFYPHSLRMISLSGTFLFLIPERLHPGYIRQTFFPYDFCNRYTI